MARLARVLSVDIPFHVTQRGNARQCVFESDADRLVYLDLLRTHCRTQRLSLLGYCLMSNHVHLIVVPARPESLPQSLKHTHGRYATYFNARHAASGHVWQGRYYFRGGDYVLISMHGFPPGEKTDAAAAALARKVLSQI
jgi:REP-associated tyrosine transposase